MIRIENQQTKVTINPKKIKRTAQKILKALDLSDPELSLVLVDSREISRLQEKYLGRTGPTDVLAFPQWESEGPGLHPQVLGDVVICLEQAALQAPEWGHSLEEEINWLLIHGILHLLGYDHDQEDHAREMEERTEELMRLTDS